ncbi:MAG: DNA polymerase III subunit gamma/tau [Clostridiaceae bacterium]|nr:DNA polymerase III subunit gamma/tau [Clostridiaceae bacterium]
MTYKALYREWRPLTFDDIVERKHVVRTLKNAVSTGQIAHAYLFCGTRGTGKTSCALILARAVNCLNPQDGNPCNKCKSCTEILSGAVSDVLEIDAASNNSVNNIRELREEVRYLPVSAKYKVYIIDEVHMLSTGAFNALLKTLEEPPAHVIFILATTEPHKLPATILSRCQRFDFRQISLAGIMQRLQSVVQSKKGNITEEALRIIARKADGALRDALSLLDQCMSSGMDKIDGDDVIEMLGTVNESDMLLLCRHIIRYEIGPLFELIDKIVSDGKKVSVLLEDLIVFFRNILVIMMTSNPENTLELTKETIASLQELSKELTPDRTIFIISELSKLENQIKWVSLPKVMLEAGLTGICFGRPVTLSDETLENRLKNLEVKVDHLSVLNTFQKPLPEASAPTQKVIEVQAPTEDKTEEDHVVRALFAAKNGEIEEESQADDLKNAKDLTVWEACLNDIFEETKPLYFCLQNTKAYAKDDCVHICNIQENSYIQMQLAREEYINTIKKVLCSRLGKNVKLKFLYDKDKNVVDTEKFKKLKKISEEMDIPFTIE